MAFGNKQENKQEPTKAASPVKNIKVGGVQVAVWQNKGKEGRDFYTFSISRSYKSDKGWEKTTSLRVNDLPKAILALQEAFKEASLKEDAEE